MELKFEYQGQQKEKNQLDKLAEKVENIKEITIDDLPLEVRDFFERQSRKLIDIDKYRPKNFQDLWVTKQANGDLIYIARQYKVYDEEKNEAEDLNYVVDWRAQQIIGHAELRYNPQSQDVYFKDKPFVGFTETEADYQRQGLNERRLFLLNSLAKVLYNQPLYSDTLISAAAKNLWEKLVAAQKAKKFKEGEHDRYVMSV